MKTLRKEVETTITNEWTWDELKHANVYDLIAPEDLTIDLKHVNVNDALEFLYNFDYKEDLDIVLESLVDRDVYVKVVNGKVEKSKYSVTHDTKAESDAFNTWLIQKNFEKGLFNKPAYDFSKINIDTSKVSKVVKNDVIVDNKKVTFKHTFY